MENPTKTKEELEIASLKKTAEFLEVHLESVHTLMEYVSLKGGMEKDNMEKSASCAEACLNHLEEKCEFFGEMMLALCICYSGALQKMSNIVKESLPPSAPLTLDEIACKTFKDIRIGTGKTN